MENEHGLMVVIAALGTTIEQLRTQLAQAEATIAAMQRQRQESAPPEIPIEPKKRGT